MTLSPAALLKRFSSHEAAPKAPATPGISASYEDMWPGGVPRAAELAFSNVDTIEAVARAMQAADRRKVGAADALEAAGQADLAQEQRNQRQYNLIAMLQNMALEYSGYPSDVEPTMIEEPARQTRAFIGRAASGEVEGLTPDMTQDMLFLNNHMLRRNEHPPLQDGQPLDPHPGESPYSTVEKADWADNGPIPRV